MTSHIPGLHGTAQNGDRDLEGLFLVRVDRAFYRWHPQKPFFALRLNILEPKEYTGRTISGRLYSTSRALWKLRWFLQDFGYDTDLLGLRGVVRVSHTTLNGHCFLNLERFAPAADWEELSAPLIPNEGGKP
jgi:hypothetical protein